MDEAYFNTPRAREYLANCFMFLPPAQREKVKTSNKWKPTKPTRPPKFEFNKLSVTNLVPKQGRKTVFRFGGSIAAEESKELQKPGRAGHTIRKCRRRYPRSKKIKPYVIRDQELKAEKSKREQKRLRTGKGASNIDWKKY